MDLDQVSSQELEDDLNSLENERRPQLFWKLKITSIFCQNGRRPQFFDKMEDNLIFLGKMGDNLKCKINGRQPQMEGKWKYSTVS